MARMASCHIPAGWKSLHQSLSLPFIPPILNCLNCLNRLNRSNSSNLHRSRKTIFPNPPEMKYHKGGCNQWQTDTVPYICSDKCIRSNSCPPNKGKSNVIINLYAEILGKWTLIAE